MLNSKGITLFELLVVIVILGILAAVAVPSLLGVIFKTEADVCEVNRVELEKNYERDLSLKGIVHRDSIFVEFLLGYNLDICPVEGVITYVDGEVDCSVHGDDKGDDDDEDDEVPFL